MKKIEVAQRCVDYFIGYGCGHNKNLTKTQIDRIEQIEALIKGFRNVRRILNEIYLEYVNEHLTLEHMAETECLNVDDLKILIDLGKKINNKEY